jgi:hypothetical protein
MQQILSLDCGSKHLGLCGYVACTDTIRAWEILNVQSSSAADVPKAVVDTLEPRAWDAYDLVLIERQPARNPRMVAMQNILHTFFVTKGKPVKLFSPIRKLGLQGKEYRGKNGYRKRKMASVAIAAKWLETHPQSESIGETWTREKKKDDLADSLLQAICYAGNPLPQVSEIASSVVQGKVIARKPSAKQERVGYTPSNLKYLLKDVSDKEGAIRANVKMQKAVKTYYESVESCVRAIFGSNVP